jgi:prophage regulatory protein
MSTLSHKEPAKPCSPRARSSQPLQVLQLQEALLKLKTVEATTALCKSTIYAKMAAGDFPQAVRLGARCTRWRAGDVSAWLTAQTA